MADKKRNKLRTSKDIYNRLKWDSESLNIDLSSIYIGYKDRFLGMCEIPFLDYQPRRGDVTNCEDNEESEIPYHRIYYFRGGGPPQFPLIGSEGEVRVREENWPQGAIFFWDRESRQDLIFGSGDPKSSVKVVGNGSQTSYQTGYKFSQETSKWENVPQNEEPSQNVDGVKLISFNILHDLHNTPSVNRWPHLIDFLASRDADVIALQEVTVSFLALLESEVWVREKYYLTDISSKGDSVTPYGQLFLTKIPPTRLFFRHDKDSGAKYIIASFTLANEKLVHIANIHLSSNYRGDSSSRREKQVKDVLKSMANLELTSLTAPHDLVITGDTNFSGNESIWYDDAFGMELVDAWEWLNGGDVIKQESVTFDVENNPLAKQQSRSGKSERFDRIFFKSSNTCKPVKIEILKSFVEANVPWFSDHYALECELKMQTVSNPSGGPVASMTSRSAPLPAPVYTSAVVIIPPEESFWPHVQESQAQFDPSFARWPPHITLLFRFVPDEGNNFDLAKDAVTSELEGIEPFQCTLSRLGTFTHSRSTTVYLGPKQADAVEQIGLVYKRVVKLFPGFADRAEGFSFTPHLTVAKLSNEPSEMKNNAEFISKWESKLAKIPEQDLTFTVDKIHFISRDGDEPFTIKKTIFLKQKSLPQSGDQTGQKFFDQFITDHSLAPSCPHREELRSKIVSEMERFCNLAVQQIDPNSHCNVHLTGSSFLTFHDDTSDMDFLCLGLTTISRQDFFHSLESLACSSPVDGLRLKSIVSETTIPIARFTMTDNLVEIDVDLVYSNTLLENLTDSELLHMTETELRCINAVREGVQLLELIPSELRPTFQTAIRLLKYWATQRNIYNKTFGYLGGMQISLLVGYVIVEKGNLVSVEDIINAFFDTFATWRWPKAVQFRGGLNKERYIMGKKIPEHMPILSPAFPHINRNLNVTKSTRSLIQREIRRGHEIFSGKADDSIKIRWEKLTESPDFFTCQEKYWCIQVSCENENDLKIISGILQSGIILSLIVELEQQHDLFVQPSAKVVISRADEDNRFRCISYLGCSENGSNKVDDACYDSTMRHFTKKFETSFKKFCKGDTDIKIYRL
ncbi:uncharacterized protein LOC110844676 isoform X2 [Folsomia candida]|uniref:uncharacterized protein LOC110844676 isoform X2 n=1 Tax=Folsomia candida TaxID=158441 RepID=UPI000B90518A|nr:uncharacterized protein LOC110844676 isoform X2 [Folsomia candida]